MNVRTFAVGPAEAAIIAPTTTTLHRIGLDKQAVIKEIIATLRTEFDASMRSARAAHVEATHEQSKAENKYDTRGLEASYLAGGQSRRAAEMMRTIQLFESLSLSDLQPGEPIRLGTLVEFERNGERTLCLIGPGGGGTEIDFHGRPILVLTSQSPIGQQLAGRTVGAQFEFQTGRSRDQFRIIAAY